MFHLLIHLQTNSNTEEEMSARLEVVKKKLAIKTSLRNSQSRSICRATIINENGSREVPILRVVPAGRKPL